MKLIIELIVDCRKCDTSVVIFSNRDEIKTEPLAGWIFTTDGGWICPDEHKEKVRP